ncbi:MAG: hypothetical protein H0V82_11555 [Candidatus Protochlamydia sp.]|nr:hypothetical protein [Candidatus Protochlamydia sp.]
MQISSIHTNLDKIPSLGRDVQFSFPSNVSLSKIIQKNLLSSTDKKIPNISITENQKSILDYNLVKITSKAHLRPSHLTNKKLSYLFLEYFKIEDIGQAARVADLISSRETLNLTVQTLTLMDEYSIDYQATLIKKVFDFFLSRGAIEKATIIASHLSPIAPDLSGLSKRVSNQYKKAFDIQAAANLEICHYYLEKNDPLNAIHYSKYSGEYEKLIRSEATKLFIRSNDFQQALVQIKNDYSSDRDEKIFYLSQIYKFYSQSHQLVEAEDVLNELSHNLFLRREKKDIFKILLLLDLADIAENFIPYLPSDEQSLAFSELFKEYTIKQKELSLRTFIAKKIQNSTIRDLALIEVYKSCMSIELFDEGRFISSQIKNNKLLNLTNQELKKNFKNRRQK